MAKPGAQISSLKALHRRFSPALATSRRPALVALALVVLAPVVTAALLWSFKLLVDEVLVARNSDLLILFATLYAATSTARIAIEYLSRRIEAGVVERVSLELRKSVYAHVLSLSPGSLGRVTNADVLTRLNSDVPKTEYVVFTGPLSLVAETVAAAVFVGFLFVLDWRLALTALAAMPAIAWIISRLAPRVRRASALARRANADWMTRVEERLDAATVVQAFSAEDRETVAFAAKADRARRQEVASGELQARQAALVEGVIAFAGLAVLAFGAWLITDGSLTIGTLAAFAGTLSSLQSPVRSLAKAAGRFQAAAAGAERVARLLDIESLVRDKPGARALADVVGRVELADVHFTYPSGHKALDGVSLVISAGETVAIVGPSGSGKSSIARLLLRQYDPDRGSITIDGQTISDVTRESLRRAVAPVFQDAMILSGTLAENIRYGSPGAAIERVEQAAAGAAVDAFAAQRRGLDTLAGPSGSLLSGGQRQRVALARAILRDAPILLLDEATAGVDSETEELIQEALDKLHGRRTLIVVAHRLSTVLGADRVIVVEAGRVIEQGRPRDLLAAQTRCRELFAAQLVDKEAAA